MFSEYIYSQNTVAYTESYMEFLSLSENIPFVLFSVYSTFLFQKNTVLRRCTCD